jgi:LCP family protein required for cell wall assembly
MNSFRQHLPAPKRLAHLRARALLLACLSALIAGLVWPAGLHAQRAGPTPPPARPLDATENILFLGADVRPGDPTWRSDVIVVLAIGRERGQVGLISIPPTLMVDIPGAGRDQIRTVDYLGETRDGPRGGPALIGSVLKQTFGIRTDHYVRMEMAQFARLVDVLGGITIVLDKSLRELDKNGELSLDAGKHRLDGASTLVYLRTCWQSSTGPNCARRHQEVIWAILQRLKELNWLGQVPKMWDIYHEMVRTDLSLADAASLALFGSRLKAGQIHILNFDSSLATTITTAQGEKALVLGDRSRVDAWVDGVFKAGCPGCSGAVATTAGGAPGTAHPASAWDTVRRSLAGVCSWAAGAGLAPGGICGSALGG